MTQEIKELINTVNQNIQVAKMIALSDLQPLADKLSTDDANAADAEVFVKTLAELADDIGRDEVKDIITPIAIKHQVYAYIGDYGNGESLLLEDHDWYDGKAGDWVSSSENC